MTPKPRKEDASGVVPVGRPGGEVVRVLDILEAIPEPGVWLADQLSPRTREAYENDVRDFVATLSLDHSNLQAELARVTRRSAIAWRHALKERGLKPSTVRRKLSALTSLYSHLVNHGACHDNPFRDLKRPKRTSRLGTTPAFTKQEAKAILDAPGSGSLRALRDHALLRVGFQAGLRRAEIASLTVGAYCIDHGEHCLRFYRKGGEEQVLPLHTITVAPSTSGSTRPASGTRRVLPYWLSSRAGGQRRKLRHRPAFQSTASD